MKVYLSLGGNIGDVEATLRQCVQMIASHPKIRSVRCSSFYKTAAVSDIPQPDFLNAACELETELAPRELFEALQAIEKKLGKEPKPKNAPRCVDIDIIWYNDEQIQDGDLQIPHPRWSERLFVLLPLSELTTELGAYNLQSQIEKLQ